MAIRIQNWTLSNPDLYHRAGYGNMENERTVDGKVKVVISVVLDEDGVPCSGLVFDLESIRYLRELGIAGVLSGTLPSATQQNLFLTVPLRLMIEEVLWLFINNLCEVKIIPANSGDYMASIIKQRKLELADMNKKNMEKMFALQRDYKRALHKQKLEKLGIKEKKTDANEELINSSLFVETPNTSLITPEAIKSHQRDHILDLLKSAFSKYNTYLLYRQLRNQNYVLAPGARFGGKYIAYPGDPLRYHSHLTIQDAIDYYEEPIDLLQLLSGARLGTTVKKLWVFGGVKDKEKNKPVSFYSVEWAGFG